MKVRFINLKYLGDFEYDTTKKGFVFIGENGSGKSLIMKHIRFIHYLFSRRIDISKIYLNQLDKKFVDLGFDEIILDHDDEKKEFGYDFYSYGQVYSIRFSIQLDDRLIAFSKLGLSSFNSLEEQVKIFEIRSIIDEDERKFIWNQIDPLVSEERQNIRDRIDGIEISDSMESLEQINHQQYRRQLLSTEELIKSFTMKSAMIFEIRMNIPGYIDMCNIFLDEKIEYKKNAGELAGMFIVNSGALAKGLFTDSQASINSIFLNSLEVISSIFSVEKETCLLWLNRKYPSRNGFEMVEELGEKNFENIIFFKDQQSGGIMRKIDNDKLDMIKSSSLEDSWSTRLMKARYDYSGERIEIGDDIYISRYNDWSFLNNTYLNLIPLVDSNHSFVGSRLLQRSNEYYDDFIRFQDCIEFDKKRRFSTSLEQLLELNELSVRNSVEDNSSLIVELVRGDARIPLNALSTGEFHALITLVKVYTGQGAIYLKEIDVFMHPNKQSIFFNEIIKLSEDHLPRLFFETHSPYYILQLQIMAARKESRWLLDELNIYYRSKSGKTNTVIKVLNNGDLSSEIPSGFDDEMTHLSMLRYHLLK